MITPDTQKPKVTVNAGERSEMQVADVAKVFSMLTSSLYSDVPQSIVREIWSNARDGHADAGCLDRPFQVTFPNALNPVFRVRDFGIGLTHEQVMGLYTNLGASTKEDSNTGVGKFGIGSKSPFAYTDNFNVATYMDGTKTFYSVVIEEGGIPAVYVLADEKTDEENGVEVTFPIEGNDVQKFCTAAHRVAFGFDVKPDVTDMDGNVDEHFDGWKELEIISEGKGWTLLKGNLEGYRGKAYAKMGCVLYPIDGDKVDGLNYEEKRMLEHTMIIDFPIGSLDITPNREQLLYSRLSPTSSTITKRLRGIITDMVKETVAVYEKCATYWEACQQFTSHINADIPSVIKDAIRSEAMWGNIKLASDIKWKRPRGTYAMEATVISGSKLNNLTYRFSSDDNISIVPANDTLIVFEDCTVTPATKRVAARIRRYYDQNHTDIGRIVWFKFRGGREAARQAQAILELIDGATIVEVADMEEPPKNSYGSRGPVKVRELNWGNFDNTVDLEAEDFDAGGYYIPLERNEPVVPSYNHARPSDAVSVLQENGVIPTTAKVYGAPKSLWKHFEGDQWVNIYDLLEEAYTSTYKDTQVQKALAMDEVTQNGFLRFLNENVTRKKLDADSIALDALAFYDNIKGRKRPDVDAMKRLARAVGKQVESGTHEIRDNLSFYVELVDEAYPLLRAICDNCRYADGVLDKLPAYVQMCDKANAATNQAAVAA